MAKMNWARARAQQRQHREDRKAIERQLHEWAVQKAERRKARRSSRATEADFGRIDREMRQNDYAAQSARGIWPATITIGPLANGCLQVITLNNRKHADALGFSWAGRPSTV